jgi:hypothetical protein
LSEVINSKICIWLAKKADVAAEGFAEEAGKSLANWKAWIGGWFIFTGEIDRLLDLLSNLG